MPKQLASAQTSLGKVRLWAGCLGNLLSRLVGRLAKEAHQCGVTSSACVHVMQCGPSFTTTRRDPLMSLAVRKPVAVMGRMRSAISLNHQRGHIDTGQVLAEVFVARLEHTPGWRWPRR